MHYPFKKYNKRLQKRKINFKMKILIMGLPGSGKTTLAARLKKKLNAEWINA